MQTETNLQLNQSVCATTNHWNGEKYHQNSDQQKHVADMLLRQFSFKQTDHVLDVGCGDGKITAQIAEWLPSGKIIGIDPSESMIHFANSKFCRDNISFQQGKASDLPFCHAFDVITSFSSLHWEPKQKEALLQFKTALKPGGTILLAIPGPDLVLRAGLNKLYLQSKWASFFNNFQSPGRIWTTNEYAQLLLETHFTISKIELVTRTHWLENEDKYKGLLLSMLPQLSCIPTTMHQPFIEELIEYVKSNGRFDESGRFKFEVKVLEIIAQS